MEMEMEKIIEQRKLLLFVGLPAIKPYNQHFSRRVTLIKRKWQEIKAGIVLI